MEGEGERGEGETGGKEGMERERRERCWRESGEGERGVVQCTHQHLYINHTARQYNS